MGAGKSEPTTNILPNGGERVSQMVVKSGDLPRYNP